CREILEKAKVAAKAELKEVSYAKALKNYRKALEDGLLKIMSKMGISILGSYRGAQIFEAIGIGPAVIEKCFKGTPSQAGRIGFSEIAHESLMRHAKAYAEAVPQDKEGRSTLEDAGYYRFRRTGE